MLSRRSLLATAGGTIVSGCSASAALNALVPTRTYRAKSDLAYGTHERQRLDVYMPEQPTTSAPMVVFYYGGSWTRGERSSYRFVGEALASAGIVTAVADYRLSPGVDWTAILDDCARAASWALSAAPRFGASAQRVYLMGHSAGAYNAAMLALDRRWLARVQHKPGDLAGWVGLAGPYDFLPISDPDTQRAFRWPGTPPDSQPLVHASAAAPRTLLLAPRDDHTVDPVRNTLGLAERLRRDGAPVRAELLDGVSHVTIVAALAAPLRGLAPVRDDVTSFVLA